MNDDGGDGGSGDAGAGAPQSDAGGSGGSPSPSPAPAFDPDAIADAVARGVQSAHSSREQQQQLTPEQVNKMLMRPNITPELARSILGELEDYTPAVQGLNTLVDQLGAYMQRIAQGYVSLAQRDFSQQLQPLMSSHERQVHDRFMSDCQSQFPALKGKEKVLEMVIGQLKADGYQPKSKADAIQHTANRAAQLIAQFQPGFNLNQQPDQTNMPSLGDAFGASGAPSGATPRRTNRSSGVEVFD